MVPLWQKLGELTDMPQNVSFLAPAPNFVFPHHNICLWHESGSGHTRIENGQPDDYYEDYLMTATYSEKMQRHQADQASRLVSLYPGEPQSFIEIGCGDGSFLNHMKPLVENLLGIEPSRCFAEEASSKGFEIICDYVSSKNTITKRTFDIFASRQVFEHLPDPLDVLKGIRALLHQGSVGLIEVPNGYDSFQAARFYDYFPDHVQYYSVNSLVELASEARFNVIACHESFGGDYLELWVRVPHDSNRLFSQLADARTQVLETLSHTIQDLKNGHDKIAIWGAGAKTLNIVSAIPRSVLGEIAFVIDSDPHKKKLFLPNTEVSIIAPEDKLVQKIDAVIILSLSYIDEIANYVKSNIQNCRSIVTINRSNQVVYL